MKRSTTVMPFNSASQNTTIVFSTSPQETLKTEQMDLKNNSEQRKQEKRLSIISCTSNNRSRKSQLFDELIEIARNPKEEKEAKTEWKSFLIKLDEYFDEKYPYSCAESARKKRRDFFQQSDTNLLHPIHHAVLNNNMFVLRTLVDEFGCDINIRAFDHETVLHLAAQSEAIWKEDKEKKLEYEMINYLLPDKNHTTSKIINAFDDQHRTALQHAVMYRRMNYANWLIEHGADVNTKTTLRATVLHFACFSAKDDDQCLRTIKSLVPQPGKLENQLVLQKNCDGLTAVCQAAQRSFEKSVEYLLGLYNCSKKDNACDIELEYGVRSNNAKILDLIYQKHKICGNQEANTYKYLLHLAAKFNNNRKVNDDTASSGPNNHQELDNVSHEISTKYGQQGWDQTSAEGYTPVHVAVHCGNNIFIQYVIEKVHNGKRRVLESTQNTRKMNVLHICAEQSAPSSSENKKDKKKNERLLGICKSLLSDESSKKTLDKPEAAELLHACDNDKNTPLHLAVKAGNNEIFECLLKSGKNLKNSNSNGEKEYDIYGVTIPRNRTGRTPLSECAKYNRVSLMEKLLPITKDNPSPWKKVLDQCIDDDRMACLHLACREGSVDTVRYLIETHDVLVDAYGGNRQTPLYLACEGGFLEIVDYLLNSTGADPTIKTAKGYNCLDIAIAKHHPEIVERLLQYSEWRTLMESAQYEGSDVPITPMRRLIISMPDIAYELIDEKFTTVVGDANQPKCLIKYDYTFIDDHYNICDWHLDQYVDDLGLWKWFKPALSKLSLPDRREPYTPVAYKLLRNHPLLLMSQCNRVKLMSHPLCTTLRKAKFARFSRWLLIFVFLSYIMFMALYTVVALQTTHPQYYYDLYNSSGNTSGQAINWDYGFSSDLCQAVGTYLVQSGNTNALKTKTQQGYIQTLNVLLIIFLIKNSIFILASFPRFIRKMAYYIEGLALILVYLYIKDDSSWQKSLNFRCPIQWELGSIGLLFSWFSLLSYMRYIPWMDIGLYIVMLEVILVKFVRTVPLLMVLFCGFGFTYYMLLQYQTVFQTPFEALFRTALSIFDLGYESRLYTASTGVMYYPVIYFVFILAAIILTILITNLLIGLAVGEIPTLKTRAKLQRNKMLYELFFDYEILHLQLKIIARLFLRLVCCACCRCYNSKITSGPPKPSAWLCEVHVNDEIEDDQSTNAEHFTKKYFKRIRNAITEDDIQPLILIERNYKKNHPVTKKKEEEEENDDEG